ncbi:tRNA (adenine(58)-N(1))-methyltransferase non-catalytic subunit TRM6 [Candida viswanathii]|uniref:tRNA (adenine(58)-N(1))-methyltransferase non-catalytic subunit TRM6 n=1 Tax=Candida viswanathii TaxID=5486 RepID=A0A367XZD6_9ASCO|nr:tRNA (adenine(58)-N(1))-methyltransferase non-catalytic subunit TRM6 [Candida viswanathii]
MSSFKKSKTTIQSGQHVLIRLPSQGLKIVHLQDSGVVGLGKFGQFEVANILGYPLGTSFEILEDHQVKPIKSISTLDLQDSDESTQRQELTKIFSNSAENNQNIIDIGGKIQKLSKEDIDELKKLGAGSSIGQLIIEKIIAGHEGFDKKTIFSQQKYLKRKQQKFLRRFTVDYLGGSELLEFYIERDLSRVLDLSVETLGLMLTYANVRPGGRYLVIDETGGVLTYAMMERMNCEGTIVSIHENEHPNLIALKHADYGEEIESRVIKNINWLQFLEPETERIDWKDLAENELKSVKNKPQYYRRRERAQQINGVIDMVENGNFDALITVTTLNIPGIIDSLLPKVGGSRPVVIYNQYKEILLEIQQQLVNDKRVLAPSIFETRVRPYQTIPGRMHPVMSNRGGGGYVLWGTRVIPHHEITAVGKGFLKRRRTDTPSVVEEEQEETPEVESEGARDTLTETTPEVVSS